MQTVIKYQDTALPLQNVAVTLFNSVTAFPPGGSFHLLNQQWFQYSLGVASAGGTAVGDVTGSYSLDNGATWVQFYTKATVAGTGATAATALNNADEVYVGMYKDIRFLFMVDNATQNTAFFAANIALNDQKSTSTRDATGALTGVLV